MDTSLATAVAEATHAADVAEAALERRIAASQQDFERVQAAQEQLAARETWLHDQLKAALTQTEDLERLSGANLHSVKNRRALYTCGTLWLVSLWIGSAILRSEFHYDVGLTFLGQLGGAMLLAFGWARLTRKP